MHDPLAQFLTAQPGDAPVALATIIATRGSTYRRPGARILLHADGRFDGALSGGCVEGEVMTVARDVVSDGAARICLYDTTSEADLVWGFGVGCKGVVEVLVEPAPAPPVAALLAEALALQSAGTPVVIATRLDSPAGAPTVLHRALVALAAQRIAEQTAEPATRGDLGHPALLAQVAHDAALLAASGQAGTLIYHLDRVTLTPALLCGRPAAPGELPGPGEARIYLEPLLPAPRLILFGAGPDATPVAAFARQTGWDVTVVDPRPGFLAPERFPGARLVVAAGEESVSLAGVRPTDLCVIMTHSYHRDLAVLADLNRVLPRYVGLMGPRDRTVTLLSDLRQAGTPATPELLAVLSSPIGLDIGGEGPEQIALAIVAEVQAVRSGTGGGRLRDRTAALHEPSLGDLGHGQKATT